MKNLLVGLAIGASLWGVIYPTQAQEPEPPPLLIALIAQGLPSQIDRVEIQQTDQGITIGLNVLTGKVNEPITRSQENVTFLDIPNSLLVLPDRKDFRQENPAPGIAYIEVKQEVNNFVRVIVAGNEKIPEVTFTTGDQVLNLAVKKTEPTPVAQSPKPAVEEIELTVTGDRNVGYRVPDASTATRTNAPIRDTPAAIQVIPQQIIRDQQITTIDQALPNVSSVVPGGFDTNTEARYAVRGFDQTPILIDGFRQYGFPEVPEIAGLDRIEVLKGPASILFGEIQPGGIINVVTKKPTTVPFYEGEFQAGSFGLIRPRIDFSGPLTEDGNLSYRFNTLYSRSGSFRAFTQQSERFFITPVLTWKISDRTTLTFNLQSQYREVPADNGTVAIGTGVATIPRERILGEPDDFIRRWYFATGYKLDHNFSDDWQLQNTFRYSTSTFFTDRLTVPLFLDETTGDLTRLFATDDFNARDYSLQTTITGKFQTGTIGHQLLGGVDYNHNDTSTFFRFNGFNPSSFAPINIFNPIYGASPRGNQTSPGLDRLTRSDRYGIFLQNQIAFTDNFKLLAGVRYENVNANTVNGVAAFTPTGQDFNQVSTAWTPRVGVVYQPTKEITLYTSYAQSFNPSSNSFDVTGSPLPPERGEGYEGGIKWDLLGDKLSATLAYYDITRQNVATPDPVLTGVSLATGEQRSSGLELDISGEILPGWNMIASYSYTDARVTRDTLTPAGNRLPGIPENSANLWTTYQLQSGDLQGLGFGVGFTYLGDRVGDLQNSFALGSYFLTNAAIFYRRDNWNLALNFRNIFDVNYTAGIPFSRVLAGTPGEPLTIVGSISVRF